MQRIRKSFKLNPRKHVFHLSKIKVCLSYLLSLSLVTNWKDLTNESVAVSSSLCASERAGEPLAQCFIIVFIYFYVQYKRQKKKVVCGGGGDGGGRSRGETHIIELTALW